MIRITQKARREISYLEKINIEIKGFLNTSSNKELASLINIQSKTLKAIDELIKEDILFEYAKDKQVNLNKNLTGSCIWKSNGKSRYPVCMCAEAYYIEKDSYIINWAFTIEEAYEMVKNF